MFDAITTRPLNPTFVSAHARPPLTKDSNERDASFFFLQPDDRYRQRQTNVRQKEDVNQLFINFEKKKLRGRCRKKWSRIKLSNYGNASLRLYHLAPLFWTGTLIRPTQAIDFFFPFQNLNFG